MYGANERMSATPTGALEPLSWVVLGVQATGEAVLFNPSTNEIVAVPQGVDPAAARSPRSVMSAQPPAPRRVKKAVRLPKLDPKVGEDTALYPVKDMSVEESADMSIEEVPLTPPRQAAYSVVSTISRGSVFESA